MDSYRGNTETTADENLKIMEWDPEGQERTQDDDPSPFRSPPDTSPMKSIMAMARRRSSSNNNYSVNPMVELLSNHESNKENRPTVNVSPLPREFKSESSPLLGQESNKQFSKTFNKSTMRKEKSRHGLSEAPIGNYKNTAGSSISPIKGNDDVNQFLSPTTRRNPSKKLADKYELIFEGIKRKTIRGADFTGAGMGDDGVMNLAELLKVNQNLKTLKLVKNKITDEGGFALVSALYFNTGLTVINLSQNMLTEKTIDAFIELCRIRKTIKTIYLSQNCLTSGNIKQKVKELAKLGVNVTI